MEVTDARTLIIDNDNSRISRDLSARFEHSKYFDTRVTSQMDEQKALKRIKQARVDILIIIPDGFEKRLLHGEKTEIGVFIDGAFPVRATTMQNYVKGVI